MKPTERPVTSRDVAKAAGVSQATVSAVLNGYSGNIRVSAATRERVLQVAQTLGYAPNLAAQALRREHTHLLALVVRAVQSHPYDQPIPYRLSEAASRAAYRSGYLLLAYHVEVYSSESPTELVRLLRRQRVDGVLLDAPDSPELVREVTAAGLRCVQLLRPQPAEGVPVVVVDPQPGIAAAIHHLVTLGHRNIGFVGLEGDHPVDRARQRAFLTAMRTEGLEVTQEAIQLVPSYALESGYLAMQRLLDLRVPVTALLASADALTLGILRLLYEHGIRVPQQLSIVSYDDAFVAHLYPPISAIAQPYETIAEQAVSLLIPAQGEETEGFASAQVVLPSTFQPRASTAPPMGR